jgi:hypothetical protein
MWPVYLSSQTPVGEESSRVVKYCKISRQNVNWFIISHHAGATLKQAKIYEDNDSEMIIRTVC